ncbi:hypothetical protein DKX38_024545 [Salix brachista]|uniref:CCHC-type domain-containing protein n=1 Tax=Salix brachista TaxID=2182728 RepID=A0A5N5JNH5_9ROSI|nr:hypothetical protein DKX38_024545 [Salix brachista]
MLNGSNFKSWKDNLLIILGVMDLDLALRTDSPPPLNDESTSDEKRDMDRGTMSDQITTAKEFLANIEKRFVKNEKAEIGTLLTSLISMKYKGKGNVREYIMEMSHLASKLKALQLELFEDLLVHLVLISLPTQFNQFKMSYNCQKETWSLNELISYCVQEEERLKQDRTESAHLATAFKDKGRNRKNVKDAAGTVPQKKQLTKSHDSVGSSCFFCGAEGHKKKQCTNYHAWRAKKGMLLALVCSEINLTSVPRHTWWLESGATTHISVSMQGCLSCRKPNNVERYIYVGDVKTVEVEAIGKFRLLLKTRLYLDLNKTFIVPSFRRNLISISALDKSGYSCSFGNGNFSLFYDSKLSGFVSLSGYDNLYLIDTIASFNESLQLSTRGCQGIHCLLYCVVWLFAGLEVLVDVCQDYGYERRDLLLPLSLSISFSAAITSSLLQARLSILGDPSVNELIRGSSHPFINGQTTSCPPLISSPDLLLLRRLDFPPKNSDGLNVYLLTKLTILQFQCEVMCHVSTTAISCQEHSPPFFFLALSIEITDPKTQ